jgi:hypothetical protein
LANRAAASAKSSSQSAMRETFSLRFELTPAQAPEVQSFYLKVLSNQPIPKLFVLEADFLNV